MLSIRYFFLVNENVKTLGGEFSSGLTRLKSLKLAHKHDLNDGLLYADAWSFLHFWERKRNEIMTEGTGEETYFGLGPFLEVHHFLIFKLEQLDYK